MNAMNGSLDTPSPPAESPGSTQSFRVAAAIAAFAVAIVLSACNTTEGVGKDIKSLGKGIEETASDAKDDMSD